MTDSAALNGVIEAFLEERIDFARFRELVEVQLESDPESAREAQGRINFLRDSGQLSVGLHSLISGVLERSSKGDVTAPIEEPCVAGAGQSDARDAASEAAPGSGQGASQGSGQGPNPPPTLTNRVQQPPTPAEPPTAGTVLAGRYRLDALLDRGGMGLVYRATDLGRGEPGAPSAQVGLKLANPGYKGHDAMRALEREASLLVELDHPGVVRMLGFEHDGEHSFLVMELLEGERLRNRLLRSGTTGLPAAETERIVRELGEILAYLHGRGVVHRDVKPANVFIRASGGLCLVDFGLAARTGIAGDPDDGGPRAGTPLYSSPELLAGGPPDPRDDVYSLACVAYELLTGVPPWEDLPSDPARRRKLRLDRPAGLPKERWKALRGALSFSAKDRPADAEAFLQVYFPPARWRGALPWAAGVAAAAVVIAAVLYELGPSLAPSRPEVAPPAVTPQVTEMEAPPAADPVADSAGVPEAVEPDAEPTPESEPEPEPELTPELTPEPVSPRAFALGASQYRISKSGGALRLELRRPAGYRGPLSVFWRTVDQTARDGYDFMGSPAWQRAQAPAGAPSLVIFIPIVNDYVPGPDVTFRVELSRSPDGPSLGAPASAEVTIVDDD
ncbi:MAG: hypothetical protein EA417_19235 [Gammaproteobacteria bacterium]|nr:MAG: hypothetical protein EA417_19235 [Gammaproteobacteria bacterium]